MKRSEQQMQYTWDLTRIFPDDAAWTREFGALREAAGTYDRFKGHLGEGRETILSALRENFELDRRLSALFAYAMMRQNEDMTADDAQGMLEQATGLASAMAAVQSFLLPEMLALPEGTLEGCLEDPDFDDYNVFVQEVLRTRPHTLDAAGERLMALSLESMETAGNVSEMLSNADLALGKVRDDAGNRIPLTQATYGVLMRSEQRSVRRGAFLRMMRAHKAVENTFSSLYAGQVKADLFQARARGFASAREAALFPEQIPPEVLTSLVEAVHGGIDTLTEYLTVRKRHLGVGRLHMYDLYVESAQDLPLTPDIGEAFDIFLRAVAPLGEDYVADASVALRDRWMDVYENEGKRSGAYSMGSVYGVTPYVLLNHTPNLDGLSTLCHEMGHAMHSFYSNRCQPYPKAEYSIFVAEVASTTNEILLNEALRREMRDNPRAQLSLVCSMLEHFRTTVFRQTLFSEFEDRAHALAEQGESLTRERLCQLYMDLNRLYYGRACVVDPEIAWEWMRVPHFYSPFYVYKYATGFCAAAALARRILSGDPEKVAAYRRFLTLGSSVPPIEALKVAGVDMSDPGSVCMALDYFAELLAEYTLLLGEAK